MANPLAASPISAVDPPPTPWKALPAVGTTLFVALFALIRAVGRFLVIFLRPDRYEDDAIQHVWWTNRLADSSLFPHDPAASYYSLNLLAPRGYVAIFRALTPWLDAQTIAEFLPFVLTIPVAALAFAAGRRAGRGARSAGVVGAVCLVWFGLHHLRGGLARSFDLPILLLGVWAVLARKPAWLGASFLLASLFYPPTLINLGPFALGALAYQWFTRPRVVTEVERRAARRSAWQWIALLILGGGAAAVTAISYLRPPPQWVGRPPTKAQALAMPEYHRGGRLQFFSDSPVDFYLKRRPSGVGYTPGQAATFLALLIATVWLFPRAIAPEAWILLGTAFLAFAAAHLLLFKLYFPNRYTLYALDVFTLLWAAGATPMILERFKANWSGGGGDRAALALAAGAAVLATLAFAEAADMRRQRAELPAWTPGVGGKDVAAFLRTLPADTLVAAHPYDADHIPLLARRSVLAGNETTVPMHLEYYRLMAERLEAELAACYAADWEDVDALHERWGVSVFVVNRARYVDPASMAYLPPFRERNEPRVERGRAQGFALVHPPTNRVLFQAGDMTVVRVGPAATALKR